MPQLRLFTLTTLAMLAFAGNSLLCRAALDHTRIDAASFTTIRLLSGTLMLWMIVGVRGQTRAGSGDWLSAFALFAYAAAFSFAYVSLSAATGALLLFGAVQMTMIGYGLRRGERLLLLQWAGLMVALCGLVLLLLPGLAAPPLQAAAMMADWDTHNPKEAKTPHGRLGHPQSEGRDWQTGTPTIRRKRKLRKGNVRIPEEQGGKDWDTHNLKGKRSATAPGNPVSRDDPSG